MKDLAKRDSWDDPRDKRTVLAFKIAHLLARPAADLHVTSKPFFWLEMPATKKHSNQTQKMVLYRCSSKGCSSGLSIVVIRASS